MSSVPAVALSDATSLKADYKVAKAQLLERFKTGHQRRIADGRARTHHRRVAARRMEHLRHAALRSRCWPSAAMGAANSRRIPTSTSWCCCPTQPIAHLEARIERFISLAWDLGLELGSSVRSRLAVPRRGRQRRHRAHLAARSAPHHRQHAAVRRLRAALSRSARPARVLPGKSAGNAPAACQVSGHAVCARAEHQGKPRRPARPATDPVDHPGGRLWQQLAGARSARPDHRARSARTATATKAS